MNFDEYPWLAAEDDSLLDSAEAQIALKQARQQYLETGAVTFPNFITQQTLQQALQEAGAKEEAAFTTNDVHTPYLKPPISSIDDDDNFVENSVYNYEMNTQVASIAHDELANDSALKRLYQHPKLLELVSIIVGKNPLFLSSDPLGCCSINVFRPSYHHSFHFDESEFTTTLMLQESELPGTGLFQYTDRLRQTTDDLALPLVAQTIQTHADPAQVTFNEAPFSSSASPSTSTFPSTSTSPRLHTLDFTPGTLLIFSGAKSLHRVTQVQGNKSRLVAVLTFATKPNFCNSEKVQKLFWGRSLGVLPSIRPDQSI